jgi:putative peptidoglycan lipid II flippase
LLTQGIRGTAFIVVPAAFGYLALATPVVRLLLEHGVMGGQSTDLVAGVLTVFSVGLFSFSGFQMMLRAFYAMQDTRTPALINVGAVALNTAVNVLYFRYLKVEGLALGHATAYTFAAIASVTILSRRLGGLEWRPLGRALAQIVLAGLAAGATAWAVSQAVAGSLGSDSLGPQLVQVGGGVMAGVGTFVLVAWGFGLQELDYVRRLLPGRLGGRG